GGGRGSAVEGNGLRQVGEEVKQGEQALGDPLQTSPQNAEAEPKAARRRKAKGNGSSPDSESKAHRLLSSARVAEGLGNYAESLKRCNQALKFEGLEIADRIELLMLRARAHYFLGRKAEAIGDWSEVMSLPSVQVNVVAEALIDRGVTWGEMGDTEKEFAD